MRYRRVLEEICRRPVAVLFLFTAATLFFASALPGIRFSTSVYDLIIEDLPENARYLEFKKIFGSDEIIRVVVRCPDVFEPAAFARIEDLAERAAAIEGVHRVVSLPAIRKTVDAAGTWSLEKFAAVVSPVSLFRKNILSEDGRTTALTLVLSQEADRSAVIDRVESLLAEASTGLSLYQIGMPLVSRAMAAYTERDFVRLPPITLAVIAGILLLLYRSLLCFILPLASVLITLIWTMGTMAMAGISLSMVTMIVPVFLIAVGTAYCLHVCTGYLHRAQGADSRREAVMETFSEISLPTILAVLTTVIGLGSLLVNRIPAIREFAVFSCLGMVFLLAVLLSFFPAALCVLPMPRKAGAGEGNKQDIWDRIIAWIIHLNLNRQRVCFTILSVLTAFCLAGALRIRVEANPLGYFKKDVPVIQSFHDIRRDLSGSFPVNVVMASPTRDYFEDPRHIADLDRLQKYLESLPGIDKAISFSEYLKLVNYSLNGFEPRFYALPEESYEVRMLINGFRMTLGEEWLGRVMNPELSAANILLFTHLSGSSEYLSAREKILSHVREAFSKDLSFDVTGFGMVVSASSHLLTSGQIRSLTLTLALVFAVMFLLFLSVKVGLIAIVPNLFPIVVIFGAMGWLRIELSMATVLIAGIAIGLGVDDTIHYLVRYNREFKKDLNRERAMRDTLLHVGKPILFTSLTISAGFSVLTLSGFKPTSVFGILMVITMISALAGDLLLLPALMTRTELVTLWDLIRLKMGKDPHRGIPLFNGLSRTQVHYVLLAGSLRRLKGGETLFHKGDVSDSMYAIISGSLDVTDPIPHAGSDAERFIGRLRTGDVVGEMGLIRSAPRSAAVTATEPVELLEVNWKMIRRLQWLYPPTAQRFFINLMSALCDRLESTTNCLLSESRVDDATGLRTTKGFLDLLDGQIHQARRYGTPLCLCLINLSSREDPEAHHRLIRQAAEMLLRHIRGCDVAGRLDDDRFAVLMPKTPSAEARNMADRFRRALSESLGLRIRVSFQVSGFPGEPAMDAKSWLHQVLASLEQRSEPSGL